MGLPPGKVIVNPDFSPGDEAALVRARERGGAPADLEGRIARAALDAALSSVARRRAQGEMIARLAAGLPLDRIVLPFLFSPRQRLKEIATLADSLDGL
jgi:hypothetical protein